MTRILGISAFYHDSAAAIVEDGHIIAAAQEERFTRVKHDDRFPTKAVQFCLQAAKCGPEDIDFVAFYEKPFPKFERLLETYLAYAPRGFGSFSKSMPIWLTDKLFQKRFILQSLRASLGGTVPWEPRLLFCNHHLSHAASAFFPSPFDRAAVLTMDGVGEWTTTSLGVASGESIRVLKEIRFPHSIGLLYSAFTYYLGFKVNSGEYKMMGLAPYGEPEFTDQILSELVDVQDDGSFWLNMSYFDFATGLEMTNRRFDRLFGGPRRMPETPITQRHMNLAASIQSVTEDIVLRVAQTLANDTGERNLCLAGGVALNCVANGKLLKSGIFDRIWIQPAAGDAGGALGAALAAHYLFEGKRRNVALVSDAMQGAFLGPSYTQSEIESCLDDLDASYETVNDHELIDLTARALAAGLSVGWHQGRMEFGPRALGARSILADPRGIDTQRTLNLKIKFRESFRPFAPSVLREHLDDWFELDCDSPYMLLTANVAEKQRTVPLPAVDRRFGKEDLMVPRSVIPAVTHVDYSARIQTVHAETNPRYYALIERFFELTGCPVLVNTSFNVRGEPIVESPSDAFRCFMGTNLDLLVVGNAVLWKRDQASRQIESLRDRYELD